MVEPYRTLADRGRTAFEIRGSEFVGQAIPATSVTDAEAFIGAVRGEFPDASHNVPAYRVRDGGGPDALLREYQNDNGEPTGSAGKPALNVLVQREIENAVVVVTRYYGGTNLGVGGLARAYGRASKEAIADAGVVTEQPHERFAVTVDYNDSGTVRSVLESAGVEFDADYAERVAFGIRVPVETAPDLRERLRSATSGRAEVDRDTEN